MAENKDGQEKTEQATAKRLTDARETGQVAKSQDVTTAGVLLVGTLVVFLFGPSIAQSIRGFMTTVLHNSAYYEISDSNVVFYFNALMGFFVKILLPLLLVIFAITFVGEVSQIGIKIATKKFTEGLQFKQIFNPFSGIKKIFFSSRSLFELGKSLAKIFILGLVVYSVLNGKDEDIVALLEKPFTEMSNFMFSLSFELAIKVGVVYIIIAVSDFYYQKWRFAEDMKMTKKEVKEESKQTEGDPQIKARLRGLMRQRMRKMMLRKVQDADVVITNPTHFAAALQYKQGQIGAPVLIAKGADFLAKQIREIAEKANVVIVEDPPLCRMIYHNVELDAEIPEELFKAVAQVLAYVYHFKEQRKKN
jgi:flagellar biosynthetic protein FlhB